MNITTPRIAAETNRCGTGDAALAMGHACERCGAMPALALLRSGRDGAPVEAWRLPVAYLFVGNG